MGSGRVTDEELSESIGSLGSFDGLIESRRPGQRDNPFGAQYARKGKATLDIESPAPKTSVKRKTRKKKEKSVAPSSVDERKGPVSLQEEARRATRPANKQEYLTEKLSLLLDRESRKKADDLSRDIQYLKKKKGEERITTGCVYRVGIAAILEFYEIDPENVPNTEAELKEQFLSMIRKRAANGTS